MGSMSISLELRVIARMYHECMRSNSDGQLEQRGKHDENRSNGVSGLFFQAISLFDKEKRVLRVQGDRLNGNGND